MPNDIEYLKNLIEEVVDELQLEYSIVEKDIYITQAMIAISKIPEDYFQLIFQGGTCLSKAHHIIERMSEDCDYRIQTLPKFLKLSKEKQRKLLREYRHDLINILRKEGFTLNDKNICIRNEGRFMEIRAQYKSIYPHDPVLKPFLKIEFCLADVLMPTEEKEITTLIQKIINKDVGHPLFNIKVISVIETAAEKWVALTRRIATMKHQEHYRDTNLVRHLYDLYQIDQKNSLTQKFFEIIPIIILRDREQYKNHNDDYYRNPVKEIKRAIKVLNSDSEFKTHWNKFINVMVYSRKKPTFRQAFDCFMEKSKKILNELEHLEILNTEA